MNKYLIVLFSGLILFNANAQTSYPEVAELVKFLVSDGVLTISKEAQKVPLSYYTGFQADIDKYFGDYICASEGSCHVVDSLYEKPYAILGHGMPFGEGKSLEKMAAQAQIERTDMRYGADIYDAATWQIALALAAKNNSLDPTKAKTLINNQLRSIMHTENRAVNPVFNYGYSKSITDPKQAFTYRMIATNMHNKDPLYSGKYQDSVSWDYSPEALSKQDPEFHSPEFFKYVSTWSDWKPITGENAWAQLIGPLQADYLLSKEGILPANTPSLVNAMHSLYAFSLMQSGIGAFYYSPGGSLGNQGPIPKGEISIENNFSVLGGLQILKKILEHTEQTYAVKKALTQIDVMLNGGITANGFKTVGLLSFLYNGAFDPVRKVFYTHGIAPEPASMNDWEPDTSDKAGAMAVDINTWGTAALGPQTIDNWFGEDTALNLWKQVREKGGYFNNDGALWGVGFTLQNNADFNPEHIMSGEWTAGAINAVEALIAYYPKGVDNSSLETDLESMRTGIKNLRNDNYLKAGFDEGTLENYYVKLPDGYGQAYLYASKRFSIPFGWNANAIPSTTSTSWVIMNNYHYNPFQYQGSLVGTNYPTPEKVDLTGNNPPQGKTLPTEVQLHFNSGDLHYYKHLALNYFIENSGDWHTAAVTETKEGNANLPKGTQGIAIAYEDSMGHWQGACQIIPATKICKNTDCSQLYTLKTRWSEEGKSNCILIP